MKTLLTHKNVTSFTTSPDRPITPDYQSQSFEKSLGISSFLELY